MNNVFGSVGKQLGGLVKHVTKQVAVEPMEVVKDVVGIGESGANEQAQKQQTQTQTSDDSTNKPNGFKTLEDYKKYQELAGNRDKMEMAMIRRNLVKEWGLETGMDKASQEYLQKEQDRNQVEEQEKKQNEAMMFEKKKEDNQQIVMAKNQASAEKRMAVAG